MGVPDNRRALEKFILQSLQISSADRQINSVKALNNNEVILTVKQEHNYLIDMIMDSLHFKKLDVLRNNGIVRIRYVRK